MAGRFATIEEVVNFASSIMKGVTSGERQMMRQWGYEAQRLIGWSKADIKTSDQIVLSSWSAAKPTDLIRTIDLSLWLSNDTEMYIKYKGASTAVTAGVGRIHTDNRSSIQQVIVTEDNDYFHVEEFEDPLSDGAYIYVKYYGLPLDTNSLPLIPEHCKFACAMFIRWMWALRNSNRRLDHKDAELTWLTHRIIAEGKGKTPDPLLGKEMAKKANSMIQKVEVKDRRF